MPMIDPKADFRPKYSSTNIQDEWTNYNLMLMSIVTTSVGQTSGRCITQLAKMSIDPKFIDSQLTRFINIFRRIS